MPLSALPRAWHRGAVRDLRARDDIALAMRWNEGQLRSVSLIARYAQSTVLRHGERTLTLDLPGGTVLALKPGQIAALTA